MLFAYAADDAHTFFFKNCEHISLIITISLRGKRMFCNSNLLVRVSRSFQGIRSFATSIPKLAAEESNDGNLPGSNYSEKSENLLVIINCF